jgi:hypothetical protein
VGARRRRPGLAAAPRRALGIAAGASEVGVPCDPFVLWVALSRLPLVVFGLYRWVRHPLYSWGLVLIWLTPHMTVNRLALFGALSFYLYVGTFFEERRLVAEFGDDYLSLPRSPP